jgi:hypothetical protein
MIGKSGSRFSDQIMRKENSGAARFNRPGKKEAPATRRGF